MKAYAGSRLLLICSGLALLAAGLAVLGFGHLAAIPSAAVVCLFAGAAFLFVGARAQAELGASQYALSRAEGESRLLQNQLDQQRRSIDTLADGLDVAIFLCDLRGSVQYANRRAVEMFRFDNPIGRSVLAVTLSYDLERLVLDAARLQTPHNAELTFSYPDERVGIAKAWVPDDEAHRVFVSVFEITNLRRLERIRQDFVSNVSHELRTPLTVIRAMAETLLDEKKPNPDLLGRYLPRIISEVDRLATISSDLLLLSTAESSPPRKCRCDLAEIIRTVTQQLEEKAKEKGLQLTLDAPEHLWISSNSAQMSQVAINLIDNAINYTSQGGVTVTLQAQNDVAILKVSDTGLGISSEHLPRVFERFYRVDRARSRSTGGTGLGLSIVKHIVEAHGGSVVVDSALNRGSTFTVALPIGDPEGEESQED